MRFVFDTAEIAHEIDKATWKKEESRLRQALLEAQYELLNQKRFPALVLIGGVEGAGKGETVNILNEWMDPRHIVTYGFNEPTEEELERPYMSTGATARSGTPTSGPSAT
jgi:polyphosphate kinase 2 (PPK2 family)